MGIQHGIKHGGHRCTDLALAGEQDHRDAGGQGLYCLQDLQSTDTGHV